MGEPITPTYDGLTEDEWIDRGYSFFDTKEYEEAIMCLGKALKINPINHRIWNKIGLAYFDIGEYKDAIKCFDHALKIDPNNEAALSNKALVFHYTGQFEDAIEYLDLALKSNPNNPLTWCNKGIALYYMRKFNEAIKCYDNAINIDSDFIIAKERKIKAMEKCKHQKAQGLEQAQNYEKAANLYEEIELWTDAGRCRELLRNHKVKELGARQPKIDIGSIEKIGDSITTNIQDSVVLKSNIGSSEKKIFKICPYCGEKLEFAEPPKFCPYCAKRIVG